REPDRAVLLVDVAAGAQSIDRLADPAFGMERALALPDIEANPETRQRLLDARAELRGRPVAEGRGSGFVGNSGRRAPDVRRQRCGEVGHIGAVVAVLRNGPADPVSEDRRAELVDLTTRIVEVVLARHLLAARIEDAAEQVANKGAAGITDRE